MKILKKICKWVIILIVSLITIIAVADAVWVYGPQILATQRIDAINPYAQSVSDFDIPDEAKIIGLGEATHGSREFQELKLSVLKTLVKKEKVRSFALEIDFAEGLTINNYIHENQGNLNKIVKNLSFTIYRTDQMKALIKWMKDYNAGKPESDQLSFYGFDMQNPEIGVELVSNYGQRLNFLTDEELKTLKPIINIGKMSDKEKEAAISTLKKLQTAIDNSTPSSEGQLISHNISCILNSFDYYQKTSSDYVTMTNTRDQYMADNVTWIQNFEERKGRSRMMISGHNGHVSLKEAHYNSMGSRLREKFQKQYFVIGTDYFHTRVNINNIGADIGRSNHYFNSADPLAAQARRFGNSRYYLDFTSVDKDSQVGKIISKPMSMGSLGEGYSFLMTFLPMSNRVKQIPKNLYDAMIFIYKANPIQPYASK